MITTEELESHEYRKFMDQFKEREGVSADNNAYKGTWQKRFTDKNGVMYFINLEKWDFLNSQFASLVKQQEVTFSGYAQFTLPSGHDFRVELLSAQDKSLMEIEAFFAKQWRINECLHYEKFNED